MRPILLLGLALCISPPLSALDLDGRLVGPVLEWRAADLAAFQCLVRYQCDAHRQVCHSDLQRAAGVVVYADIAWARCAVTRHIAAGGCAVRGIT